MKIRNPRSDATVRVDIYFPRLELWEPFIYTEMKLTYEMCESSPRLFFQCARDIPDGYANDHA